MRNVEYSLSLKGAILPLFLKPSAKVQFQPELYLVIQLVLYKLGMWDRLVTPGGKLQNLRYTPTKWGSTSSRKRRMCSPLAGETTHLTDIDRPFAPLPPGGPRRLPQSGQFSSSISSLRPLSSPSTSSLASSITRSREPGRTFPVGRGGSALGISWASSRTSARLASSSDSSGSSMMAGESTA